MPCRYSTGWGVSGSDALIQDFYAMECQNPVNALSLPSECWVLMQHRLLAAKAALRIFNFTCVCRPSAVGA